jgi:hypothetical protein
LYVKTGSASVHNGTYIGAELNTDITGRRTNILEEATAKFESQTGISGRLIPYQCDLTVKEEVIGEHVSTSPDVVHILISEYRVG